MAISKSPKLQAALPHCFVNDTITLSSVAHHHHRRRRRRCRRRRRRRRRHQAWENPQADVQVTE